MADPPTPPGPPGPAAGETGPAVSGQPDPAVSGQPAERQVGRSRLEFRAALEIMALCGLVITQPLLDVTGRSPDFFLFHGAGAGQILLLVALFALLPPVGLWCAGALVGLAGPTARALAHTVTLAGLLSALAIQVGKQLLPLRGIPLLLVALIIGAAGGYAYRRWQIPGQLLRVASVGPLVFVSIFVFVSPTSAVVLPGAGSGTTSGATRDTAGHPPVVMLVLDEFPLVSLLDDGGAIDAERFPNIARLAGESTWYRNSTAVSGWTPYALPAMLTGQYPSVERAPHYSQYPENLFTAFGAAYDIRAQETITQLCPPAQCPDRSAGTRGGLPTLVSESIALLMEILSPYDSDRDPEASYREPTAQEAGRTTDPEPEPTPTDPKFRWGTLDENQPARFTDFIAGLRRTAEPTLHFLHLLLPHSPWNYLPSGVRYESAPRMRSDGDGWVSLAYERHLAQVEYTDRLIGETLRTLDESGLYDEALVVVTADHGVSFTPGVQGRSLAAVQQSPAEVLWVPTFIKAPGERVGRVDDRNWEHVDLLPTIAEHAGVEVSWRTDGASALGSARAGSDKRYHNEPDEPTTIPGSATFAELISGAGAPTLPDPPSPELVGRAVAELTVADGGGTATVMNLAAFGEVDPASGRLPALVYGTVPGSVPDGATLAVAVNGRVGAVVPVVEPDQGGRRFAALLPDDSLFVAGGNQLEIFEVADGGVLHRLRV